MKNIVVKGALCALLCVEIVFGAAEEKKKPAVGLGSPVYVACEGEDGPSAEQAEHAAKLQSFLLENVHLKSHYSRLLAKVIRVCKDEEVVAARKEVYCAVKKMVRLMKGKMELTPQELADIEAFVVAIKKADAETLSVEDARLIEDHLQAINCVIDLHMWALEKSDLEAAAKAEFLLFKNS